MNASVRLRRLARAIEGAFLEPAGEPADGAGDGGIAAGRPGTPPAVLVSAPSAGSEGRAIVAAHGLAVHLALDGRPAPLVLELSGRRPRPPTFLASASAQELERALREAGGPLAGARARGRLCSLVLPSQADSLEVAGAVREAIAHSGALVLAVPPGLWSVALCLPVPGLAAGALWVSLPRDRALAALAVRDLRARGLDARVLRAAPGPFGSRRALAGVEPGGAAGAELARAAARDSLRPRPERDLTFRVGRREGDGERPTAGSAGPRVQAASGQALPALLGGIAAVLMLTLAIAAIGGAVTGKGRLQRSADLAAVSAARQMRDDLHRVLAPARLPDGRVNPEHLVEDAYRARAGAAAREAAERNGVPARRARVQLRGAAPPVRVVVRIAGRHGETVRAVAEVGAGAGAVEATGMPSHGSGGGYSGPLVHRNGEGMRPDVARAYDAMASAARRAGIALVVTSGFRSDAEQARLWARNPDPRWVARPGTSLHRCATELDLGPRGAWPWLAANAPRFGFLRRYPWEPWHFGYTAGPPPCSKAGEGGGAGGGGSRARRSQGPGGGPGDGRSGGADAVPAYVPAPYRPMIAAAAGRSGVSPRLLAAQLRAESGFNPRAVSPAGAQGIAQFMPATARAYGLGNPFDPAAAIDAQARLMAALLRQFGNVSLALAAYNAGPGAVQRFGGIPPYAETRAYVARILAIIGGAGGIALPAWEELLEVRLVE